MCLDKKEATLELFSQDLVLLKWAVVGNCSLKSIETYSLLH